jgi:hypothetical protein
MGHAVVAFTDARGFEAASFPEVTRIADEQLFSEPEMSKYCFESYAAPANVFAPAGLPSFPNDDNANKGRSRCCWRRVIDVSPCPSRTAAQKVN